MLGRGQDAFGLVGQDIGGTELAHAAGVRAEGSDADDRVGGFSGHVHDRGEVQIESQSAELPGRGPGYVFDMRDAPGRSQGHGAGKIVAPLGSRTMGPPSSSMATNRGSPVAS